MGARFLTGLLALMPEYFTSNSSANSALKQMPSMSAWISGVRTDSAMILYVVVAIIVALVTPRSSALAVVFFIVIFAAISSRALSTDVALIVVIILIIALATCNLTVVYLALHNL